MRRFIAFLFVTIILTMTMSITAFATPIDLDLTTWGNPSNTYELYEYRYIATLWNGTDYRIMITSTEPLELQYDSADNYKVINVGDADATVSHQSVLVSTQNYWTKSLELNQAVGTDVAPMCKEILAQGRFVNGEEVDYETGLPPADYTLPTATQTTIFGGIRVDLVGDIGTSFTSADMTITRHQADGTYIEDTVVYVGVFDFITGYEPWIFGSGGAQGDTLQSRYFIDNHYNFEVKFYDDGVYVDSVFTGVEGSIEHISGDTPVIGDIITRGFDINYGEESVYIMSEYETYPTVDIVFERISTGDTWTVFMDADNNVPIVLDKGIFTEISYQQQVHMVWGETYKLTILENLLGGLLTKDIESFTWIHGGQVSNGDSQADLDRIAVDGIDIDTALEQMQMMNQSVQSTQQAMSDMHRNFEGLTIMQVATIYAIGILTTLVIIAIAKIVL